MKTFIIIGKSGSGKDTLAEIIKDYYNLENKKTIISGYSKYLKLYAKEMLGWDFSEDTKPRTFLQKMGSYIRYDLEMPNMLSDRLLTDIDIYKHFYDVLVISDARLPEEVNYLRSNLNDAVVIKIIGDYNKKLSISEMEHETEKASEDFKGYDYLVENDINYKSLRAKVFQLLESEN